LINANYAKAYYNLGVVFRAKKSNDMALRSYTRAIEIDPGFVDAYYNRASVYYDEDEYRKAAADFRKITEIDSTYADAYYSLGATLEWLKDYDPCIEAYNNFIKFAPPQDYERVNWIKEHLSQVEMKKQRKETGKEPLVDSLMKIPGIEEFMR
jgi:tetratricopeptide (TPR) repeat protein